MALVIFDIDGTLTATSDSDVLCYGRAFEKCFGFPPASLDWHDYEHVTDSGVAGEILESARGRFIDEEEIARFEKQFLFEIEQEYASNPEGFREIAGAVKMLEALSLMDEYQVALATGGMRATALFKLAQAGIDGQAYPAAFSNDDIQRSGIVRKAVERSGGRIEDAISVGDGLWDLRTAEELGIPFVGITHESEADRLTAAGATTLVQDYSNLEVFLAALESARDGHQRKS
jgi:phosphoglycolate phosphatase-like HAD superfamily hydrolase